MAFQRPIVPSVALERICFTFALGSWLLIAAYLLWVVHLGHLVMSSVPELMLVVTIAVLPAVYFGSWLRYRRNRKVLALREYEHILRRVTDN